jgi:hypothetical protein
MARLGHIRTRFWSVALTSGVGLRTEVDAMRLSELDRRLHDDVALGEIELYAEILSAVAVAERPLTDAEIDIVLGVRPEPEL